MSHVDVTTEMYDCKTHGVNLSMCCGKGSVAGWVTERKKNEDDVSDSVE